jgi:hypothetical protein
MLGRTARASVSADMRMMAAAAPGLAADRSKRPASNSGSATAVGATMAMAVPVPHLASVSRSIVSTTRSLHPQGASSARRNRAVVAMSTSAVTRSGWVAAKSIAIGPPSDAPTTTARSEAAASITARKSSMRCSSVGSSATGTGSDSPVPGLSKVMTRLKAASRSMKRASPGICQVSSRWLTKPGMKTTSTSPAPNTW